MCCSTELSAANTHAVARARAFGYDPERSLAEFNACPLFTALGDSVVTGPTLTNVNDFRAVLITPAATGRA